jgi:hypothetical protein
MVFKSMRGSLFIMAPTSTFSIPTRCVAQDHPAYIPRGRGLLQITAR